MKIRLIEKIYSFVKGNRIILQKEDGRYKNIFYVKGLKVNFKGCNGKLIFKGKIPKFKKSHIIIGDNGSISIASSHYTFNNFSINSKGRDNICKIGKNFSCTDDTHLSFGDEDNLKIIIGEECMFASNILVRASDFHPIMELGTRKRLNKGKDITIGNHCWLATNATILKGSTIPDDCIIATGSLVTKKLTEQHAVYAGIPAKQVKTNVTWDREYITSKERN